MINDYAAASRSLANKERARTVAELTCCSMSNGPEPSTQFPRLIAAANVIYEHLQSFLED